MVRATVSRIPDAEPPYQLQVDQGENGKFLVNGGTGGRLLPSGPAPQEVVCRLLDSLMSSQAGQALGQTYRQATKETGDVREALELVRASYYLPGACRACPRYGGI